MRPGQWKFFSMCGKNIRHCSEDISLAVLLCQGMWSDALSNESAVVGRENTWQMEFAVSISVTSLCPACPVGPLIGKYCGTKTPSELRSATGILSLTFHTDMAVAKDGFSARYYLVPQEPQDSELAGREPLVLVSGPWGCTMKRGCPAREKDGNSVGFAMASEFRQWELYLLAGGRLMKTKHMSIWMLTSLKKKYVCQELVTPGKVKDHFKPQNKERLVRIFIQNLLLC